MKKALGKVIVAFLVCLLSFAVVSPRPAMADEYYCDLAQQLECVQVLPLSGDLLFENIPPYGLNSINVTFINFSDNEAVVNSNIGAPIRIFPGDSQQITYPVEPASSVTFSNESPVRDTAVEIQTFGYN